MRTSDFDYYLPEERIAQEPAAVRDACKLLVMNRTSGKIEDRIFRDIYDYIQPGDILIANETRVMPARLFGVKQGSGGAVEILLLRETSPPCHPATQQPCHPGATTPCHPETTSCPPEVQPLCHPEQASHDVILSASEGSSAAKDPWIVTSLSSKAPHNDIAPSCHPETTSCHPERSRRIHVADAQVPTTNATKNTSCYWEALVRPGKRLKPGAVVNILDAQGETVLQAEIVDWVENAEKGERLIRLTTPNNMSVDEALHLVGHTPLPPYIKNYAGDEEMYQTVFSKQEKSAAAPTAGLHFTPELIEKIKAKGAHFETVELEVGLDTFRIVDEEDPQNHRIHSEFYSVSQKAISAINEARAKGGRVIAVGTTSVRSLESAWDETMQSMRPRQREATTLYLLPGSKFHVVDALITNFHVPRSTLMMLVSAFSSREHIMNAYQHAVEESYRFLSFGDAMFIC